MAKYMGSYVRERVFEKTLKDENFRREVYDLLVPLATVLGKNETVERRASRSTESALFHQWNIEGAEEQVAYRIIGLNRRYCDGKLIRFVHMDNDDEIEDLLCDFWEACVHNYKTLLEAA